LFFVEWGVGLGVWGVGCGQEEYRLDEFEPLAREEPQLQG